MAGKKMSWSKVHHLRDQDNCWTKSRVPHPYQKAQKPFKRVLVRDTDEVEERRAEATIIRSKQASDLRKPRRKPSMPKMPWEDKNGD